jgi:hypothetical protein
MKDTQTKEFREEYIYKERKDKKEETETKEP